MAWKVQHCWCWIATALLMKTTIPIILVVRSTMEIEDWISTTSDKLLIVSRDTKAWSERTSFWLAYNLETTSYVENKEIILGIRHWILVSWWRPPFHSLRSEELMLFLHLLLLLLIIRVSMHHDVFATVPCCLVLVSFHLVCVTLIMFIWNRLWVSYMTHVKDTMSFTGRLDVVLFVISILL